MNLFEVATRRKYRFPFRGSISVEDLWDLTPNQLDSVYKELNKTIKTEDESSLLARNAIDETVANMIEIVKHIFNVKQEEKSAREAAAKNAAKKERILEVIAQKQDESLQQMSVEELQKMVEDLG